MNIDASGKGVPVVGLAPTQPKDAGDNGVSSRSVGLDDFTGPSSALEDRAGWSAFANLLGDDMLSKRRPVATPATAETELGRRNGISLHGLTILHQQELLVMNADQHGVIVVDCGCGSAADCEKWQACEDC